MILLLSETLEEPAQVDQRILCIQPSGLDAAAHTFGA